MNPQSLRLKLKLIPLPIRSWFASEEVSLMIQSVNQHFNIQKKDGTIIPDLLLRLEAKDLSPDYFSGELSEILKLDRDKALGISAEIKRIILSPIKKDFLDIGIDISLLDQFKIPAIKESSQNTLTIENPTLIRGIGSLAVPTPLPPKPMFVATNVATSKTFNQDPSLKSAAIPNANIAPRAPQTNRLSDIGWSKSRTADPVVKLDISQVPQTAPVAPQQKSAMPAQPSMPSNPAMGEFARLNAMKKAPVAPPSTLTAPTGAPKPPVAEPAPFILHQDSSSAIAPKNADFKISQPQTSAEVHFGPAKTQSTVRPAVLEFAGQNNKPAIPTPAGPTSAVHYTEFQSSLSKVPTQSGGPRQVSQILPPKPPTVPTAQKEPVIVKDFL